MTSGRANSLPEEFIENVIRLCGVTGQDWLEKIPKNMARLAPMWNIRIEPHFPKLYYNYVAPGKLADGTPVVVKLALPVDDDEIFSEADYLRFLDGDGAVRLIAEDRELRALLMEQAIPGHDLKELHSAEPSLAVKAGIRTLRRVICDPPSDTGYLIDFADWYKALQNSSAGKFPRALAERAFEIFERPASGSVQLIHGDFHHANILSNGPDDLIVIDPKGVIGDVRYDIAVFLNNHQHWLRSKGVEPEMEEAVALFAEAFELDSASIKRWAFAQLVLSSFWTCTEGGDGWCERLATADIWNV